MTTPSGATAVQIAERKNRRDLVLALTGRIRSPRYTHLHLIPATGQVKTASLLPPREEPAEEGGLVRGADYYAGGAK